MLIQLSNRIENIEVSKTLNFIIVKDIDKQGLFTCLKWVFE